MQTFLPMTGMNSQKDATKTWSTSASKPDYEKCAMLVDLHLADIAIDQSVL